MRRRNTEAAETVPARLVPKNVVEQLKWRINDEDELVRKRKHRVTTDDSIEPDDDGDAVDARQQLGAGWKYIEKRCAAIRPSIHSERS